MKDRAPREKASERNMGLGWATWSFLFGRPCYISGLSSLAFGLLVCSFMPARVLGCRDGAGGGGGVGVALLFRKLRLMAEVPSVEVLSMKPKEGRGGGGGGGGVGCVLGNPRTRTHGSSPWWERVEEEA